MDTKALYLLKSTGSCKKPIMLKLVHELDDDTAVFQHIEYNDFCKSTEAFYRNEIVYDGIRSILKQEYGDSWWYDIIGEYILPKNIVQLHFNDYFE